MIRPVTSEHGGCLAGLGLAVSLLIALGLVSIRRVRERVAVRLGLAKS